MRRILKIALRRRGMSQRDLARSTNLSDARISEILNGWRNPRPAEQDAIAEALGVGPESFIDEAEHICAICHVDIADKPDDQALCDACARADAELAR